MNIKDKVVVITGGSSGIGKETAIHLSRLGAKVILVARSRERLVQVQDAIMAIPMESPLIVACDITSEEDVSRMAARVGENVDHVDVLINSAGIGRYRLAEAISNPEMRRHFEVNVYGAFYCIKALLPLLKSRGSGYILNVGSIFSKWVPFPEVSVYAASKFALRGFSDGLRRELKPYGISVGFLMPGAVNTPFQDQKEAGQRKAPALLTLEADDVAKAIEKMIRRGKKNVMLPRWISPLVWMRTIFD
jgi:short-subunit dehydrogenase